MQAKRSAESRGVTARELRDGNAQRSRDARTNDLRESFGPLFDDRNRMVSVETAVRLALAYGQKRWAAGRNADHSAIARRRIS